MAHSSRVWNEAGRVEFVVDGGSSIQFTHGAEQSGLVSGGSREDSFGGVCGSVLSQEREELTDEAKSSWGLVRVAREGARAVAPCLVGFCGEEGDEGDGFGGGGQRPDGGGGDVRAVVKEEGRGACAHVAAGSG